MQSLGSNVRQSNLESPIEKRQGIVIEKKLLKLEAEDREFAKILRSLNRTIYSNREKSEQFLATEYF